MQEHTNQQSYLRKVLSTWNRFDRFQKIAILAAVLALASPFFNWFHSCITTPGNYACETWNGFEKDNDIYGLLIFIASGLTLYSLIGQRSSALHTSGRTNTVAKIQLGSGIFLLALALIRLITFPGKSSHVTSIGPSLGLFFVICAGLVLVFSAQHHSILGQINKLLKITSGPKAVTKQPEKQKERVENEADPHTHGDNDQLPNDLSDTSLPETPSLDDELAALGSDDLTEKNEDDDDHDKDDGDLFDEIEKDIQKQLDEIEPEQQEMDLD